MSSKRNKNAGKHASYAGMTQKQIEAKRLYDTKYNATKERKRYRADLNKENRESHKAGTTSVGDGMDKSHTKNGEIVNENQKTNRGRQGRDGKSTKK